MKADHEAAKIELTKLESTNVQLEAELKDAQNALHDAGCKNKEGLAHILRKEQELEELQVDLGSINHLLVQKNQQALDLEKELKELSNALSLALETNSCLEADLQSEKKKSGHLEAVY